MYNMDNRERRKVQALTDREIQVARLVEEGLTNKEVGERLGITERTAKAHCDMIRFKIGISRRRLIPKVLRDLGIL